MTTRTDATLDQLLRAAGISGVLTPEDPAYADAVGGFNTHVRHRPDAVVLAGSEGDVAAAVAVAAQHDVPVTALGAGHGSSTTVTGGLAIATDRLAGVQVDAASRTATIGAGTQWGPVIEAAAPYGLAPLAGSAPHVGVVGYLLGGGLGPVARTYGFAADHVRSFRVVTGPGRAVTASPVEHAELFWALRGGKGGLGIVTQVTVDLLPIATLHGGGWFFDAADASTVLHGWIDWAADLPTSVSTSVAMLRLPPLPELPEPLRGRTVLHVRAAVVGGSPEDATSLAAPVRALATPVLDAFGEMPYAALGAIHADPVAPMPVVEGGVLLEAFDHRAADALLAVAGPQVEAPFAAVELRLLGGAIAVAPAEPNAVGGRDAAFHLHVVGAPVPELLDTAVPEAVDGLLRTLEPWSKGRVQANFHGNANLPGSLSSAWPAAVRARLRAVRFQYDPSGRFPYDGHEA
jgi:FAD/FMN-containing dehydrogenase